MDAHDRHDRMKLAIAADHHQRVVEMAALLNESDVPGAAIPEFFEPLIGLAHLFGVGAPAHRLRGESDHQRGEVLEDYEQIPRLLAPHCANVGAAVRGELDHALRIEPLQRLTHGAAAHPQRLGEIGFDQLLPGDIAACEDALDDRRYDSIGRAWFADVFGNVASGRLRGLGAE